jgi:hypothetical protein
MAELIPITWKNRNGYPSRATTGDVDYVSPARMQVVLNWSSTSDPTIQSYVIIDGVERMIKYYSTLTPAEIATLANA